MSLIIILHVVLTTLRSGALICYHRRPILLLVPQSRKRGYAPGRCPVCLTLGSVETWSLVLVLVVVVVLVMVVVAVVDHLTRDVLDVLRTSFHLRPVAVSPHQSAALTSLHRRLQPLQSINVNQKFLA